MRATLAYRGRGRGSNHQGGPYLGTPESTLGRMPPVKQKGAYQLTRPSTLQCSGSTMGSGKGGPRPAFRQGRPSMTVEREVRPSRVGQMRKGVLDGARPNRVVNGVAARARSRHVARDPLGFSRKPTYC